MIASGHKRIYREMEYQGDSHKQCAEAFFKKNGFLPEYVSDEKFCANLVVYGRCKGCDGIILGLDEYEEEWDGTLWHKGACDD